jgi:hypothetical protein
VCAPSAASIQLLTCIAHSQHRLHLLHLDLHVLHLDLHVLHLDPNHQAKKNAIMPSKSLLSNHELFEKWRTRDVQALQPLELAEYHRDQATSRKIYDVSGAGRDAQGCAVVQCGAVLWLLVHLWWCSVVQWCSGALTPTHPHSTPPTPTPTLTHPHPHTHSHPQNHTPPPPPTGGFHPHSQRHDLQPVCRSL